MTTMNRNNTEVSVLWWSVEDRKPTHMVGMVAQVVKYSMRTEIPEPILKHRQQLAR